MKKFAIAIAAVLAMAGAQAATVSFTASKTLSTTNWTDTLTLGQFNSALGTLTGVSFSYTGTVVSDFRLENTDAQAATVTANSAGTISFSGPFSDALNILGSATRSLGAFDGTIDFGGTSGAVLSGVTGTKSGSFVASSGALSSFIGAGVINVGIAGAGASTFSAAGNVFGAVATRAGADITVTYTYTVPTPPPVTVPEPSSLALVGLALAGAGLVARRRQA